jgi:hypothetical protein
MWKLHKHSPGQAHGGIKDWIATPSPSDHHHIPALFAQRFFCFFSSKEKKEEKEQAESYQIGGL